MDAMGNAVDKKTWGEFLLDINSIMIAIIIIIIDIMNEY